MTNTETTLKPWKTLKAAKDKAAWVGGWVQGCAFDPKTWQATRYLVIGSDSTMRGSAIFHKGGLAYELELCTEDRLLVEGRI